MMTDPYFLSMALLLSAPLLLGIMLSIASLIQQRDDAKKKK